jgi:hypothetical protein
MRAPQDGAEPDGARAHQLHLIQSAAELAWPRDLRARRDELELAIIRLRREKDKLPEEDYLRRLEPLLVELARLAEQVEAAGARQDPPADKAKR